MEKINVQQEISYATNLKKKCLIILLEENIDFSLGIQIYIKDVQIINAFEKSYDGVHKSYYIFKRIMKNTQKTEEPMEIPGNPVPIIKRDGNLLKIDEDILSKIENLEAIAPIVIVGPYRTGKSYIMNRFLKRQKGFALGGTVDACTEGIWMWDTFSDKKQIDGKEVTLLYFDTEGIDAAKGVPHWDIKLFTLALLMSSFFIYNSKNAIGKSELSMISAVTQISEKVKIESQDNNYGNEGTDFLWSLRDFYLENIYDKEEFIGDKYLENALQLNGSTKDTEKEAVKEALQKTFRKMLCHTIKSPTNDVTMLQNLDNYDWQDLDIDFRNSIDKLCARVKTEADAKHINGLLVNGSVYADFIRAIVKSINENKQIHVAVSLAASIQHVLEQNKDKATFDYKNAMDEYIAEHGLPQSKDNLREKSRKVYKSCTDFLAKSNFGSKSQVEECMKTFEQKIYGRSEEDKTSLWYYYYMQNVEAIKNFNKEIIFKLYDELVKSKLSSFKTTKEYEDALNKVLNEYQSKGYEGEEMINIKDEFLKSIKNEKTEFMKQLQIIIRQQEALIEQEKKIEEEKRKREQQEEKIKNVQSTIEAVNDYLDSFIKQIEEKEKNYAEMQEKIKNFSKDEAIKEQERQTFLILAKNKEEEIKRDRQKAKEIENELKSKKDELIEDKRRAKETGEQLLKLRLTLENIKN